MELQLECDHSPSENVNCNTGRVTRISGKRNLKFVKWPSLRVVSFKIE